MTFSSSLHNVRHHQRGFSLLELSIALAVIGIVVAGGLSMSTSMVDRQAYVQTGNQMEEIEKALAAYVAVNKRLPCPSDPTLALSEPDYGMSGPGACSSQPVQHTTGTGGEPVAIGMLPVRTLGLRDRYGADEYGNRYTYAVTEALTTDAATGGYSDPDKTGAITMEDNDGNPIIDDAAYVLVSHGGDSKGAYRYETASQGVICAGGLDAINCDRTNATFRDARFNRGTVAGFWFDDSVRFARKEIVNMNAGGANSGGTQLWTANGNHIYNANSENVGVGIANPSFKFDVLSTVNQNAARIATVAVPGGSSSSASALTIASDGGIGINMETWNAQHGIRLESNLNENGLSIITKGNDSKSLWIDHVGDNGIGTRIVMNNGNSVGLDINSMDALSTGIQIQSPDSTNSTGILIDNVNTAIDVDNVIFGLKVDVDSALGSAVFGTSSENNLILFRGNLTGNSATGVGINMTGTNAVGIRSSLSNTGWAMYGENTVTTGTAYGVYGRAASATGYGVYGTATDATGLNYGVYGVSASSAGRGVYGEATATSGTSTGVFGRNWSTTGGHGVYGLASGASGTTNGVFGQSLSSTGRGVYGHNPSTTGFTYGLYGEVASADGVGAYARATATSGNTYGFRSRVESPSGVGIYAEAASTTGTAVGVSGRSYSPTGRAVEGWNNATSGTAYGVYGRSASAAGYGIYCAGALCGGTIAWTPASDARLKENIVTLTDAYGLDAIRKLHPVTYDWKDTAKKKLGKQVGFIAQEVEKIFPELVVPGADLEITLSNGKKETVKHSKAMAYETLTVPLVRAVQQLADTLDALFDSVSKLLERVSGHDADITALKADNAALKADNATLKARLDALEAKVK